MSKVTWQFFGGINTIGGTIIVIECAAHRLIFDMGRIFNPNVPIFDASIQARGIHDLQRLGIAPRIPGLFAGDGTDAPDGVQTLIAVSHSHLDHVGLLPFVRTDIPVLLTTDTYQLLQALDDIGDGPGQPLHYSPVEPGSITEFGPFRITTVLVDHDTPGACAFFIETPEVRFVYSGDLRLHGDNPEQTEEFARLAREFQPDVLFIEGTRARSEDNSDTLYEKEVQGQLIEVLRQNQHGAYFTFYPRHPERLTAFAEAAKATGRQLVADAPSAYIYEQFGGDVSEMAIYGAAADGWNEFTRAWVAKSGLPVLSPSDLQNESAYLVEMLYRRLTDWVDIDVRAGGQFIHSNGAPLGPFDPAWNNLMYWLDRFGLTFQLVGSTGHASRGDILHLIDTIQPRVLMPIHSLTPERIGLTTINRLMPQYGKTYSREDLAQAAPPTTAEIEVPFE